MIKSQYKIPKDNQFLNAFDKGMKLNKNSFENSFEHFQGETKSPSIPTIMMKNYTLLSNIKKMKQMAKLAHLGKKID